MRLSFSILLCKPRNCRSFLQSLKAVTKTTTKTAIRIATPSIHSKSSEIIGNRAFLLEWVKRENDKIVSSNIFDYCKHLPV